MPTLLVPPLVLLLAPQDGSPAPRPEDFPEPLRPYLERADGLEDVERSLTLQLALQRGMVQERAERRRRIARYPRGLDREDRNLRYEGELVVHARGEDDEWGAGEQLATNALDRVAVLVLQVSAYDSHGEGTEFDHAVLGIVAGGEHRLLYEGPPPIEGQPETSRRSQDPAPASTP